MSHSSSEEEIKVINDQLAYLTEEIAYLKGEDIGLIKRLIQLHIMISRQKREDARIAALIEEEEEEEGEESRDTRVSLSSEPGTPGPYKYEEPSVDDVERELTEYLHRRMRRACKEERRDILEVLNDIKTARAVTRRVRRQISDNVTTKRSNNDTDNLPSISRIVRSHSFANSRLGTSDDFHTS
ncbi:hypothetical protein ACHWQZ_G011124 [Mnemiopsis leidyi]